MGIQPLTMLVTFAASAEAGARLILQRNRAGFTAQVTNAVKESQETRLEFDEFRELAKLASGRKEGAK